MIFRTMFQADSLPVLAQVLRFTEARHRVLAANVANAETPSYRRKDLLCDDFQAHLARAVEERRNHPGRFDMEPISFQAQRPRHSGAGSMLRHDGNNVDLDREMAQLVRNALLHNTAASLLQTKFATLARAVSGRTTST